jgi:hypothetical protein
MSRQCKCSILVSGLEGSAHAIVAGIISAVTMEPWVALHDPMNFIPPLCAIDAGSAHGSTVRLGSSWGAPKNITSGATQ